jgi:hypothetical protein
VGATLRLKAETTWNGDDMTAFLAEAKAAIAEQEAAEKEALKRMKKEMQKDDVALDAEWVSTTNDS